MEKSIDYRDARFDELAEDAPARTGAGSLFMPPGNRKERRQLKAIKRRLTNSLAKGNFTSAQKHWRAYKDLTGDDFV